MRILKRISLAMLLAGLIILIDARSSSHIPAYGEICSADDATQQKNCASYYMPLVVAWQVGKFIDDHNGAIVAIFTIILAVSTIGLWRATNKLWDAGREQAKLMEDSIAVAAKSADATVRAADAARATLENDRAWITWGCIIFGDVKNSMVNGEYFKNGMALAAEWKNTGRSPAMRVSCVNLKMLIDRDAEIPTFSVTARDPVTQQSSRGVGEPVSGVFVHLNDAETNEFRNHTRRLFFYSRVTYTDIFNLNLERISETCLEISFAGGTIIREGHGCRASRRWSSRGLVGALAGKQRYRSIQVHS